MQLAQTPVCETGPADWFALAWTDCGPQGLRLFGEWTLYPRRNGTPHTRCKYMTDPAAGRICPAAPVPEAVTVGGICPPASAEGATS